MLKSINFGYPKTFNILNAFATLFNNNYVPQSSETQIKSGCPCEWS